MINALTIDVEDYYHVSAFDSIIGFDNWGKQESRIKNNVAKILSILAQEDVSGTFFILGWVAENYPSVVKNIQDAGHEIEEHYRGELRQDRGIQGADVTLHDVSLTCREGRGRPFGAFDLKDLHLKAPLLEKAHGFCNVHFIEGIHCRARDENPEFAQVRLAAGRGRFASGRGRRRLRVVPT